MKIRTFTILLALFCAFTVARAQTTTCDPHFAFKFDSTGAVIFNGAPNANNATYNWNFGDGKMGMGNPVDHRYANPGTYNVCLTVTVPGMNGTIVCKQTWCDSVRINNPPPPTCTAKFTYKPGNNLYSVIFTSSPNSTPGTQYMWSFGDGTTSPGYNPDHIYPGPGTYYACLTVKVLSNTGTVVCTDTYCDSVKIGTPPPPPSCDAHFTWRLDTAKGVIIFTGANNPTGTIYKWSFGDYTNGDGKIVDHRYMNPGTYWVCLTVYIPSSSTNVPLCKNTWCDSVKIGFTPPPPPPSCNAHFTFKVDSTGKVIFTGAQNPPGATYQWSFGDNMVGSGNPVDHRYANPGTYWVCLTVTVPNSSATQACKTTWCDSIRVGNPPPPPPPTTCDAHFKFQVDTARGVVFFFGAPNPPNTNYYWSFGDGTSGVGNPADHRYINAGTYWVCLKVVVYTNSGLVACKNEFCDSVRVPGTPPPPPPPTNCFVKFEFKVDTATNTVHFFSSQLPAGTKYLWTFGDSTTSTDQNPVHQYASKGVYQVCLHVEVPTPNGNVNKCQYCAKVNVGTTVLVRQCSAKFTYNSTLQPYTIKFQGVMNPPGTTYLWTFGDGDSARKIDPIHVFPDTGLYTVCLTVTSSSANSLPCTDTYCRKVYVNGPIIRPIDDQVMLYPNPATTSTTVSISDIQQPVTFILYNFKGEVVFSQEHLDNGNHPVDTGKLQPGLYYYRVVNGTELISSGKLIVQ